MRLTPWNDLDESLTFAQIRRRSRKRSRTEITTSVRRAPYPSSPCNDSFVARMPNLLHDALWPSGSKGASQTDCSVTCFLPDRRSVSWAGAANSRPGMRDGRRGRMTLARSDRYRRRCAGRVAMAPQGFLGAELGGRLLGDRAVRV